MAECAMSIALGVVILVLGGVTGGGTYAAPMIVAGLSVPLQQQHGTKSALMVWICTGILGLLLVPDLELALTYLLVYGWYPPVRAQFLKLPRVLSAVARLAVFNATTFAVTLLTVYLTGVTDMIEEAWFLVLCLVLGSICFVLFDTILLPKTIPMLCKHWSARFKL